VSRPPRIEFAGAVHHAIARGDRREDIFRGVVLGQGTPIELRKRLRGYLIVEIKDPFEAVKLQQVLGGEGLLRKPKDQLNQRAERPKNYGQKKNWPAVGAEQILERVSEYFQSFNPILRGSRNGASATIWHGGVRLRCAGSRRIDPGRNCGAIPYAQ
jgi:hypothetical protein